MRAGLDPTAGAATYTLRSSGTQSPVRARGERQEHIVGYTRGESVAVLAPRLVMKLNGKWGDTTVHLLEKRWVNRFTGRIYNGGALEAKDIFHDFPVALLMEQ